MSELVNILKKVIGTYNFLLMLFGTIGNSLTALICSRRRLRKVNTFKLFSIIAVLDIIGLYEWNLRQFVYFFFGIDLVFTSLVFCDLSTLIQHVCFESSAWILVNLSVLIHIKNFELIWCTIGINWI